VQSTPQIFILNREHKILMKRIGAEQLVGNVMDEVMKAEERKKEIIMIDLVSDTVTKPTAPMLSAMMNAAVGDDVFRQDPAVNALEEKAAALFGHEAALFCPSGTMTNQIALKVHTRPLDEVICDEMSHIYQYEVGGYAFHSGIAVNLLHGENGILTAEHGGHRR
jgi:tryptophanase